MKRFFQAIILAMAIVFVTAPVAIAGVLQTAKDFAGAVTSGKGLTTALITAVLLAIFRWIPNDLIKDKFGWLMERFGNLTTLFMNKFKFTAPFWETVIEPFFIDLIDNVLVTGIQRYVKGLRHDYIQK